MYKAKMAVPAQAIRCWILTVDAVIQPQVMEEVILKRGGSES